MSAGDIYTRRNGGLNTVLPNAGSNLDADWDTVDISQGNIVSYTNPNFQLDTGLYLILYSEKFNTTDVTNNERIEIQGEIHISGTGAVGGYAQDYIRKASGQQEAIVSGYQIIDITSDNTDLFIRFYRTDNSTTGTVNRVPGTGSVTILELDDTHNYGLYSTSASEATSGSTERTLNINTNDRQDTGFSRTGSAVDVSTAGRYLATYSLDLSTTGTGREDLVGRITNAGTEIPGTNSYCYIRGADGCQDGALTWIGILDLAGGEDLDVRWSAPQSATVTAAAGAQFQIWQLPSSADSVIMEATTGDYNSAGSFTFDTLPHIDTDSFTATAGTSNIDIDQQDYALTFASFHQDAPDSVQRGYPEIRVSVDGVVSNTSGGGVYHRNSGGSGIVSVTVADIKNTKANDSIAINITPEGASGAMNNDSAQFAVVSLESIFGPYSFPPAISDFNTTNAFTWGTANIVINGASFGAVQGSGKVEIWDDLVGTTKTVQTIDSWSNTSIQIDSVRGSLPDNTIVYVVVTSDSGNENTPFVVNVGLPSYTISVGNLNPDHYWTFDNTYNDIGDQDTRNASVNLGSPGFSVNPLTRGRAQAFTISAQGQRIEIANSNWMNLQTETTRTMGGWIRVSEVQDSFVCFYEEGGGVNNLAFFMGMGGIIVAQMADTSDDNVHAYSDFKLDPNRDYHIMFRFDYTGTSVFELLVDGVLQSVTFGNPLTSAGGHLDAHSGNVGWGDAEGTLEVFGTDITFPAAVTSYYQDWATWTTFLTNTQIRETLFELGCRNEITISSDTEANMQLDLDTYASTVRPNNACTFVVEGCSDGNFTLDFDNITFNSGTSIQIQYRGSDTLTANNLNGSNLESSKMSTVSGGTIVIVTPSTLTVTNIVNPTEVRVYQAGTQIEVAGQENVTTGTFTTSISVSSVDIVFLALSYQNLKLTSVNTSSDASFPVNQLIDRQYENV